jgi:hypothetical protein
VVQKTMQPSHVSLWLRTPHGVTAKGSKDFASLKGTQKSKPGSRLDVTPPMWTHHPPKDHRGRLLDIWRHRILPRGSRREANIGHVTDALRISPR